MKTIALRIAAVAAFAAGSPLAASAESLTLYCAADEAWCQQIKTGFEEKTGITVDMTRKSSGETYAQLRAEAGNPKGDVWWGGTGDPHLQAAQEGLTEEYVSPVRGELHDWAIKQAEAAGNKTVGVYSGALSASVTTRICWPRTICRCPPAGPISSSLNTRVRSRWPTRTLRAPPTRCLPRSCS
jgi:iron(III) transport system substrate-binding protein